jgi:L-malate glycosyltransferase
MLSMTDAANLTYSPTRIGQRAHVLFIIDQLCETGGAERMLLNTIRLLPRDRFRCSLVTFKIDTSLVPFMALPCPHFVFPMRRTYDWNALKAARQIRSFIRRENVQIVHTFHETSDLWGGWITRMTNGPALISSRRDMGILRSAKHSLAYRMMNSQFDVVLTVSDELRQFCIQCDRIPPHKVITLYNGLEVTTLPANGNRNLRQSIGIAPDAPVIITVGHIRRVKGLDVLVETAARVVREFPRALFLIVGRNSDPQYFQQVFARIDQLRLRDNIKFLGESERVFSLLNMGDVFFLPSRSEGFSNALIEAMACGLPCVATRVGGNAEAVEEGRSGYLVENEDADAAANRISTLLGNLALAKKMGAAGKKIVAARFTAKAMIEQLVAVYDALLAARRN